MLKPLACGMAAIFSAGIAWAQTSRVPEPGPAPRVIRLDTLTCQDALSLPIERRERLLIYLNGYLDGRRGASSWEERLTGERLDRALGECKLQPRASALSTFTNAWTR